MSELRKAMNLELKNSAVPILRDHLFKGSFPHFRRLRGRGIDLLTFQFSMYGSSFIVEIARCKAEGITAYEGKHIPPNKVRAWDIIERERIGPPKINDIEVWFRFDQGDFKYAAQQFLSHLPVAEAWWKSQP